MKLNAGNRIYSTLDKKEGVVMKHCNCTVRKDLHYEVRLDGEHFNRVRTTEDLKPTS